MIKTRALSLFLCVFSNLGFVFNSVVEYFAQELVMALSFIIKQDNLGREGKLYFENTGFIIKQDNMGKCHSLKYTNLVLIYDVKFRL